MEGGQWSFNSRAHGGRDTRPSPRTIVKGVSIHAPTGGATEIAGGVGLDGQFQFTRPRGARRRHQVRPPRRAEFQFTRPRGARPRFPAREPNTVKFQFTRPRGARPTAARILLVQTLFQFTRPRGARRKWCRTPRKHWAFQFTRPRGARPFAFGAEGRIYRFNSRAHGGRDEYRYKPSQITGVSIHAPTGGATTSRVLIASLMCFNSRAHGGRDSKTARRPAPSPGFNSRAHGGRDGLLPRLQVQASVSIHAPTGGATADGR